MTGQKIKVGKGTPNYHANMKHLTVILENHDVLFFQVSATQWAF